MWNWIMRNTLDRLVAAYLRSRGLTTVSAVHIQKVSRSCEALVEYTRRSGFLNNPGNQQRIPKARNRCRYLASDIKSALLHVEAIR